MRLDVEELNEQLARYSESGWVEAHIETWIRETARDLADEIVRIGRGLPRRRYLIPPEVIAGKVWLEATPEPTGPPFAQIEIEIPRIHGRPGRPEHIALALEPEIRAALLPILGRARADAGVAGT